MNSSVYASAILDRDGAILMIAEDGIDGRKYYNLPYVKLEQHERLEEAILREIGGRIGIECSVESLVGIYTGFPIRSVLCFMFKAAFKRTRDLIEPRARWMSREEIEAIPNGDLINSSIVRTAISDCEEGAGYDLGIIKDLMYGKGQRR